MSSLYQMLQLGDLPLS